MIQRLILTRPLIGPMVRYSSIRCLSQPKVVDKNKDQSATTNGQDQGPIKFTSSDAHLNYKAVRNFYGDDKDLPESHNLMLSSTMIIAIFYLMFIRDDIDDNQGTVGLFKPVHETLPHLAIPMLKSAIEENKRSGLSTKKMEEKLAEYMKQPAKYGGIDAPPTKSFMDFLFGAK